MRIYKVRLTFSNCQSCEKSTDGEIINVIEMIRNDVVICDDCLKGLGAVTNKVIEDGKSHMYISENRTVY